jgi:hypothetical protein
MASLSLLRRIGIQPACRLSGDHCGLRLLRFSDGEALHRLIPLTGDGSVCGLWLSFSRFLVRIDWFAAFDSTNGGLIDGEALHPPVVVVFSSPLVGFGLHIFLRSVTSNLWSNLSMQVAFC